MKDIRDFYITWKGHPRYNENEIIVDSVISVLFNKIEMVLFTNKGEFIGDYNFGCDLELYLWQTNVSIEYIKNVIQTQFDTYIPELRQYYTSINIEIMESTLSDIMVVNILVNEYLVNAIFR